MTAPDTRAVRQRIARIRRSTAPSLDDVWWLCNLADELVSLASLRPRVDAAEPTVAALICEETMD